MKVAENQSYDNQPSTSRKAVGITTGAAIGLFPYALAVKNQISPISEEAIAKRKRRISFKYPELGDFTTIKGYADDILDKKGLKAKGVEIKVFTPEILRKIKPLSPNVNIGKRIKYTTAINRLKILANGLNACFIHKNNTIVISNQRLYSGVFHEIGHAMNYHSNKFSRAVQLFGIKIKKISPLIALTSLGIGLFGDKKSSEQGLKRTKFKKLKDFMHDNAGKITFLTFIPLLIEEGKASIKGAKIAKPYLNQIQRQKHAKMLFFSSFCSYLKLAGLMPGAVAFGIFAKDKIVNHKIQLKTGGN